jgi:histone H3/H4
MNAIHAKRVTIMNKDSWLAKRYYEKLASWWTIDSLNVRAR